MFKKQFILKNILEGNPGNVVEIDIAYDFVNLKENYE